MPSEPSMPPFTAGWRRSSFCVGENNCVEVARSVDGSVILRNSQRPDATIALEPAVWQGFLDAIKVGQILSGD